MRASRFALSFVVLLLTATACSTTPPPRPEPSRPALRFAIPNEPLAALALVALSDGLDEQHGVAIETHATNCGVRSLDALIEGEYDLALTTDVAIAIRSFDTDAFRVIAAIGAAPDDSGVVALKSGGVRNTADLKGRRIGVVPNGLTHSYLHLLLDSEMLDRNDVELVFLKPGEGTEDLRAGTVAAISTRPPLLDTLVREFGDDAQVLRAPTQPAKALMLVARPEVIQERRADIEALLASFIAAEESARDIQHVCETTATWIGTTSEAVSPRLSSADLHVRLEQWAIISIEQQVRWVANSSLFTEISTDASLPNTLDFIDATPLGAVAPERVTIIGWSAP